MKYTEIQVRRTCYVNSGSDYFATVAYKENGIPYHQEFLVNSIVFLGQHGYDERKPKYMVAEVMKQLRDLTEKSEMVFIEGTQTGEIRHENLRYYDQGEWLSMLGLGVPINPERVCMDQVEGN